jgi:D-alanine-D-alanine ligase
LNRSMAQTRVLILYNSPTLAPDHPDAAAEAEVLQTASFVAESLEGAGFQISRLGMSHDPQPLLDACRTAPPDVVFNLYEGTADDSQTEAYVAGLLEWLRVPYTGCPPQAIALARDKPRTKILLKGAGLPTPRFQVVESLPCPICELQWPVMVKLAAEDASIGIDQQSVVNNQEALVKRVKALFQRYHQPVLIEEFIDGREFNVAIIENPGICVLPISEIVFSRQPGIRWNIVTYDAKWLPNSAADRATTPHCPADIPQALAEQLQALATRAFRLLGCRDYARIDFRVSHANEPFVLEINPNPDFHPTAGLAPSLRIANLDHAGMAVDMVRNALARKCPARLALTLSGSPRSSIVAETDYE